jgi:hypothetical protein
VQAVGYEGSRKSNTRKTRKPSFNASVRKEQKKNSVLEQSASVARAAFVAQRNSTYLALAKMAVGQQALNTALSSSVWNQGASEVYNSCTSISLGNLPETMRTEEFVVRPHVSVAPGAYATPQTVNLVHLQENAPPSQLEDTEAESNNTIRNVDVFSVHEKLSTLTPVYVTGTLEESSKLNWHSPSPTEDQSNPPPHATCGMQSCYKKPSTIRNWHTPVTANYPQKASKKDKVVESGSAVNSMSFREEECEVLDQIAKANMDSIAQYWERCPSGFMCKICNKQYKILKKCEIHVQIHLGVYPYECQICKHRFLKRRKLNEHFFYATGRKICTSVNYVTVRIIIGGISRLIQRVMKSSTQFMCVEYAKRNVICSSNIGNILFDHITLGMHKCKKLSLVFFTRFFY